MPPACLKQAFRIVALDRCGNHSRSKRSRSNVPLKYASARRFFARLASEIFLTSLQTAIFFNNLLDDPGLYLCKTTNDAEEINCFEARAPHQKAIHF